MLKKMTGIDVFEIALAFNPVNKKKFFTVKDGAVKPELPVTPTIPATPVAEEIVKDVTEPPAPVTPVEATPAIPAVPVTDPPAPIVDPAAVPVTPPVTDPPTPAAVEKDGEQFKSFKDTITNLTTMVTTLKDQMTIITTTLKDASILPTVEPDKSEIVKDGSVENSMFLPGSGK